MALKFRELDDFHPDRLFQNLAPFQKLRELREGLEDGSIAPPPRAQASASAADRPRPASGADLLRDMIGEPATPAAPARRSDWDQMLHDIVAPYAVPGDNPRKAEMVAQTDRAIAGEMRAVLHHRKFQALEAAWRGLYFLVRRLETGESLRIFLLDLPREALTTEALRRAVDDEAWGVIAGLYYFESKDQDSLREISFVARIAGAPFIASLGLGEVGLDKGFAELRAIGARALDWTGAAALPAAPAVWEERHGNGIVRVRGIERQARARAVSVGKSFDCLRISVGRGVHTLWLGHAAECRARYRRDARAYCTKRMARCS